LINAHQYSKPVGESQEKLKPGTVGQVITDAYIVKVVSVVKQQDAREGSYYSVPIV